MSRPVPSPRQGSLLRCLAWTLLASLALSAGAMAGTLLPPDSARAVGNRVPFDGFADQNGRPLASLVTSAELQRDPRPWIVSPMYTRCPHSCSALTAGLRRALDRSGLSPSEYRIVSFSFDPKETDERLRQFRARMQLPSSWLTLRARRSAVAAADPAQPRLPHHQHRGRRLRSPQPGGGAGAGPAAGELSLRHQLLCALSRRRRAPRPQRHLSGRFVAAVSLLLRRRRLRRQRGGFRRPVAAANGESAPLAFGQPSARGVCRARGRDLRHLGMRAGSEGSGRASQPDPDLARHAARRSSRLLRLRTAHQSGDRPPGGARGALLAREPGPRSKRMKPCSARRVYCNWTESAVSVAPCWLPRT